MEWAGFATYRLWLNSPKAIAIAFTPRDFRPVQAESGRAILTGRFLLAGLVLETGQHGDPWDSISPSRRFAIKLHGFSWLPDLLAAGEAGEREALRLFVAWRAEFEQITPFAWGWETLERRVFNLACGAPRMLTHASEREARLIAELLARQARRLVDMLGPASRRAERLTVAAIGLAALADPLGSRSLIRLLPRLCLTLEAALLADGGLRSRSPEQGLELLYDLLTLEDLLSQRGMTPPAAVSRAIDRLTRSVQFLTLRDGRLASFHGGESVGSDRIQAALQHEGAESPDSVPDRERHSDSGYVKLSGGGIEVVVDADAPPVNEWSIEACDQPLAMEVVCGKDRLITNCGWSPAAAAPLALRLATAGSTASLGGGTPGILLSGFLRRGLGARLVRTTTEIRSALQDDEHGVLLELSHDGWVRTAHAIHQRRLFIDRLADELRGEDCFRRIAQDRRQRPTLFSIRFHLATDVQVSLALDKRSVLLRGPSNKGWWFRNDAQEVSMEPSIHYEHGSARRAAQIVLRGWIPPGEPMARVRWKLTPVDASPEQARRSPAEATP